MVITDKLNVLTTGLANSCTESFMIKNLDIDWLVNNPSTILWADNILFTKYVEEFLFERDETPLDKSLNLIFETLKDNNVVRFKNSENIYNDKISEKVSEQISKDLASLQNEYGSRINVDKNLGNNFRNIFFDGKPYCGTEIMSIYASLIISEKWGAKCLFSNRSLNFLKYKLNLSHNHKVQSVTTSFNDIFKLHLPDLPLMQDYVISQNSNTQNHENKYESEYLNQIEDNLWKYLDLREYDEIKQIKEIAYNLNKKINSDDYLISEDLLLNEYREKRRQTHKTIHTLFPKIKKWTNYSMILIPTIEASGWITGSNLLNGLGIGLGFLGGMAQLGITHIENKNKWVGFKVENEFKKL